MSQDKFDNLKRQRYEMPEFVRDALTQHKVTQAYQDRPAYQQNDYIGWITRAKLPATRDKRLAQMLQELIDGNAYMKMPYQAKPSATSQELQPDQ
jgi:uncharacterized protein YdeI (YjbR/CyaY-like superfamily)